MAVSIQSYIHGGGVANQSPFTLPGPLHSVGGGPRSPDALEGPQPTRLPLPKPPGDLQAPERLSNRHLQLCVPEHDEGLYVQGLLRALCRSSGYAVGGGLCASQALGWVLVASPLATVAGQPMCVPPGSHII